MGVEPTQTPVEEKKDSKHGAQEILANIAKIPTGEWSLLNVSFVQGPKEGPQVNINYSPDLQKEMAINGQVIGLRTVADVNEALGKIKDVIPAA